jgi:hypothetical protein
MFECPRERERERERVWNWFELGGDREGGRIREIKKRRKENPKTEKDLEEREEKKKLSGEN